MGFVAARPEGDVHGAGERRHFKAYHDGYFELPMKRIHV
jgi:hypothetical protein